MLIMVCLKYLLFSFTEQKIKVFCEEQKTFVSPPGCSLGDF